MIWIVSGGCSLRRSDFPYGNSFIGNCNLCGGEVPYALN